MPAYLRPIQLMELPEVKAVFKSAQQIGNFISIYEKKIEVNRIPGSTVILVEKDKFLDFVRFVEGYGN